MAHPRLVISRNRSAVGCETSTVIHPLIDLNDHALAIDQERHWYRQIALAIEHMAVENVVDARDFFCREHNSGGRSVAIGEPPCIRAPAGIVEVDSYDLQPAALQRRIC